MDMTQATAELTKYMTTLNACLSLARRMGLGEDIEDGIMAIQRMISMLYMLKAAYLAVAAARLAAGDPLAWIQAGVAVGGAIATMAAVSG